MLKSEDKYGSVMVGGELKTYKKFYTALDYTPWLYKRNPVLRQQLQDLPPCTFGTPIIEYLNDPTVRSSLHIPHSARGWDMCRDSSGADPHF